MAIMDSIADLKQHCDWQTKHPSLGDDETQDDDTDSPFSAHAHALLLFGPHSPSSRADLIAALPSKNIVDRYISRYFNFQDLVSCQYAPSEQSRVNY